MPPVKSIINCTPSATDSVHSPCFAILHSNNNDNNSK